MTRFIYPSLRPLAALRCLATLVCFGWAAASFADEGHAHDAVPAAAARSASPRINAHSELFELTGIVDKGQMTLYLDRYDTNEPVLGARIGFEAGTVKGEASPQADGTYLVRFDALAQPGEMPISFTVTAGKDTDLLAGDLTLADVHAHGDASTVRWSRWAPFLAGLPVLLALAAASRVFLRRRRLASRALPVPHISE